MGLILLLLIWLIKISLNDSEQDYSWCFAPHAFLCICCIQLGNLAARLAQAIYLPPLWTNQMAVKAFTVLFCL